MHMMEPLLIAYIDPGTGGVILQLLIAGVVGAGFYFRRAIKKIMSVILRRKPEAEETDKEES